MWIGLKSCYLITRLRAQLLDLDRWLPTLTYSHNGRCSKLPSAARPTVLHHILVEHQIRLINSFNLPRSGVIKRNWQRINNKFLVKVKKTSTVTFNLLRETYGKTAEFLKALSQSDVTGYLEAWRLVWSAAKLPMNTTLKVETRRHNNFINKIPVLNYSRYLTATPYTSTRPSVNMTQILRVSRSKKYVF